MTMELIWSEQTPSKLEVQAYVADNNHYSLVTVQKYPAVKAIIVRYNTTQLFSALVDILEGWSGDQIESARQNQTDECFERLLMLTADTKAYQLMVPGH